MIPILILEDLTPEQILNRDIQAEENVSYAVDAVIAAVRQRGDAALLEYTEKCDGVKLSDLQVSDEAIIRRMSGRRVCGHCGASYHTAFKPSAKPGICDRCSGELIIRKDDEPATVVERLKVYHEQTEPLVDFYRECGKLIVIQGQDSIEKTTVQIMSALEAKK